MAADAVDHHLSDSGGALNAIAQNREIFLTICSLGADLLEDLAGFRNDLKQIVQLIRGRLDPLNILRFRHLSEGVGASLSPLVATRPPDATQEGGNNDRKGSESQHSSRS